MRIALIATSQVPSRKANAIRVMKVAQAFAELGHSICLWLPGVAPDMSWEELAQYYGLRVRFPVRWLRNLPALRRYDFSLRALLGARRWSADLFYLWPLQAAATASWLGWPTLLELHDRPTGRFGPSLFRVFLRGSGAARLLTITEALRRWLADRYPFPARSGFTVVTPSGVDLERYEGLPDASTARRQLDIPDVFTAGYTGHLYPGRGLELMMELARLNPEIQMIWAGGEEPAVERWRRRVALSGPENLKLLGFISQTDLPLVQAACDVLMLPHEARVIASGGGDISAFTSPLKVFEYLAAGRAILASDLPVLREALDDHLAVFAPANDIQTWNRELGALRADPERRQRMGEGARAHARQFSWTARARKALLGLDVS